jgi:hypothetical protein
MSFFKLGRVGSNLKTLIQYQNASQKLLRPERRKRFAPDHEGQ